MIEQINKQIKILLPPGHERLHQGQAFPEREKLQNLVTEVVKENVRTTPVLFLTPPCPSQDLVLMENVTSQSCRLKSQEQWCYTDVHRFFQLLQQMWDLIMESVPHTHRNGSKFWYQSNELNIQNHLLQTFIYFVRKEERKGDWCTGAIWPFSRCLSSFEPHWINEGLEEAILRFKANLI